MLPSSITAHRAPGPSAGRAALLLGMMLGLAGCTVFGHGAGKAGARGGAPLPATAIRYTARATDPETGRLLYLETHDVAAGGRRETIHYQTPKGKPLGEKTIDFSGDAYAPLYRLELASGYSEATTARSADGLVIDATYSYGPQRTGGETGHISIADADKDSGPLVVDEGLPRFVADNLPALAQGASLAFHLGVVPNMESYALRVEKIADTTVDGHPAVTLEVNADSFLLRLLATPAQATYDPASRRVLRYEGVSSIRDPRTGKVYDKVRIDYAAPQPAP